MNESSDDGKQKYKPAIIKKYSEEDVKKSISFLKEKYPNDINIVEKAVLLKEKYDEEFLFSVHNKILMQFREARMANNLVDGETLFFKIREYILKHSGS